MANSLEYKVPFFSDPKVLIEKGSFEAAAAILNNLVAKALPLPNGFPTGIYTFDKHGVYCNRAKNSINSTPPNTPE